MGRIMLKSVRFLALAACLLAGLVAPAMAADLENTLYLDAPAGRFVIELPPTVAPVTVGRVKELARQHFYDGLKFHRVIDGFMAQTGDPLGTGEGQSSYPNVKAEFTFRRDASTPYTPVSNPAGAVDGFLGSL